MRAKEGEKAKMENVQRDKPADAEKTNEAKANENKASNDNENLPNPNEFNLGKNQGDAEPAAGAEKDNKIQLRPSTEEK